MPAWTRSEAQTSAAKCYVVAVDRPGYGLSDRMQNYSYSQWARDSREVMQQLGAPQFSTIGYSSGGPFALATAALVPECVSAALISSDGPYREIGGEDLIQKMYGFTELTFENSVPAAEKNESSLRTAYEGMKNTERRQLALADLDNAVVQGLEGAAFDAHLEAGTWGFDLEKCTTHISLFHGKDDDVVPVSVAEYLHSKLKHSSLSIIDGENHTLPRRHWQSILSAVRETSKRHKM